MIFCNSFKGLIEAEITSADSDTLFDAVMSAGISVYSVAQKDEITSSFLIGRDDLPLLRSVAEGRGDEIRILRKSGIYWQAVKMLKRPVIIVGTIALLLLTLCLPDRIFFICVEGNQNLTQEEIVAAAEKSGLMFGSRRKFLRSEGIKNRMLSILPELEWIGVNTKGCVAYIRVAERTAPMKPPDNNPCSIVAARDGIVSSLSVRRGSEKCAVGDPVVKGQLLISGYTDCGNVLLSTKAEGKVYAYTSRQMDAVIPRSRSEKSLGPDHQRRISIQIGKKRINLWKGSGICPVTYDRMYREYWLTLPGEFRLPLCLVIEQIIPCTLKMGHTENDEELAGTAMENYLMAHMPDGKILQQQLISSIGEDLFRYEGIYGCLEMIGQVYSEKTGEIYG